MDEINKLNHNEYAYLRQLPIDKLLELLAAAPVLSACSEDEAYVDALEEAIIEKENENSTGFFPDVDQQWEQFTTHYLPDADNFAFKPEHTKHTVTMQPEVLPKRVVRFKRVWRTALVAAAAAACMLAAMVTAQAAGVDVFGAMARWTEAVFSFGPVAPDSQVSDIPLQEMAEQAAEPSHPGIAFISLQEALDACGMTEVHEPAWLPEGYALGRINVLAEDDPYLRDFEASYTDGEGLISIGIMSYEGAPATQVQKIDGPVESVEKNGIMFYHIENSVGRTIAWCSDRYEYYVSSKEGIDILWQVVESMFE